MTLTISQSDALVALDSAIADALALDDGTAGGDYDRTLVARCDGICAAVQIREPNWSGFPPARAPLHTWSAAHPPR